MRPRVAFIGNGRLTSALAPALARVGYPVVGVWSRPHGPSPAAAGEGKVRAPAASAQAVVDSADIVFLAVPDGAIQSVAESLAWRPDVAAIHCSGAAGVELLAHAAELGAQTAAFHPLQTLPGGEADLAGVTAAIEAQEPLAGVLQAMALDLGCRPLRLPSGARPLYHASAVLASNALVALLDQAAELWPTFGVSREEGLQALLPLVRSTVENVARLGPEAALTGPIARGDAGTVRRHLQALADRAPAALPMYRQLGKATIPLAARKGTLGPAAARELETILQAGDSLCV